MTQATKYAAEWGRICAKAGIQFNKAVATDRFLKAHSFRVADIRIGITDREGKETWIDPITWRDNEAPRNPVPEMITLAILSAKKNQNGNRPQ